MVQQTDMEHQGQVSEVLDIADGEGAAQIREVSLDFHHLFALSDQELGVAAGIEHHIETGSHRPIAHK
ncbi:MAG: hypothetical protein GY696_18815 [Gammaproteobacteria bacterium]|nr:hypothetical protein [Gammaproteobacteria bacterium]